MIKTKEEVLQLLVDLGETKEAVGDKLLSMGIKGDPKNCKACPIAQYLISNGVTFEAGVVGRGGSGGPGVVLVHEVALTVGYYWFSLLNYPQVKPVYDFIWSFDAGKYPQLVKLH